MQYHRLKHAALTSVAAVALLFAAATSASAQAKTVRVSIAPQSLGSALKELARQAELNILFSSDTIGNRNTPELSGALTQEEALRILLAGSGLEYRFTNTSTVTITENVAGAGASAAPKSETIEPRAPVQLAQFRERPSSPVEEIVVTGYTANYAQRRSTLGSKSDDAIRDIPQSVMVLTEKLFLEQQPVNLEDIVRNTPGLSTVSRFGGRQDHIALRGFEMGVNRNGVLRNGVQSVSRVQSEVGNLGRVEILKGPSSILYGRLEVGGIINSVTRKPEFEQSFAVTGRVASYNDRRGSVDINTPLMNNKMATRLYVSYADAESFRDTVDSHRYVVNPSITYAFTPDTTLTFEYEKTYDSRTMDRGLIAYLPRGNATGLGEGSIVKLPLNRFLGDPDNDRSKFHTNLAWLTFEHRADSWTFTSLNHFGRGTEQRFNNEPSAITSPAQLLSGTMTRTVTNGKTKQELHITDNYGSTIFDLFGMQNRLIVGGTLRRDIETEHRVARRTSPINIYTGFVTPLPANQPRYEILNGQSANNSRTETAALYLSNRLDITQQFKILASLRYENIRQKIRNGALFNANGTVRTQPLSRDYKYDPIAPAVGLIFQPTEEISLYANYTESFSQQNDAFLAGNAEDLESGRQYEVGVKGEFLEGMLNTTLAAYKINKKNITVADGLTFIPIGEAESQGIEFDINARLIDGWELLASYAYTDTETLRGGAGTGAGTSATGAPLPGVAKHTASLWTSYTFGSGWTDGLTIAGGIFFVDRRAGNAAAQFFVPGYARTDVSVTYRLAGLTATFLVSNLLDREYYVGARGTSNIEPGPPRTFSLTLGYRF
jgi:iron complex outermembrane receptor protein